MLVLVGISLEMLGLGVVRVRLLFIAVGRHVVVQEEVQLKKVVAVLDQTLAVTQQEKGTPARNR